MNKIKMFKKMSVTLLMITMTVILAVSPAFASENEIGPGNCEYFQGEELRMLSNQSESQMMSFVLTSKNGAVIVIDGGTEEDAAHLREVLAEKGNHVNAWFITHPHSDHAGALTRIIEEGAGPLIIDSVYYNFAGPEWYRANEEYRADFAERVRSAVGTLGDKAKVMHRGDVIDADGISVLCMNDPYLIPSNAINNSSSALKVEMGGKKILFLGDMGVEAGDMFLADHAGEDLGCDMVQMAHHGQNGVGRNVYEAIHPHVCLWCAPGWLYDDPYSRYRTGEVRNWMKQMNVNNNQTIKNGDRILK